MAGGVSVQDVQNALGVINRAESHVQQAKQLHAQIEQLEADIAALESDANRKTRIHAFLDSLDDEGKSSKDLKTRLDLLAEIKEVLEPHVRPEAGPKKGGK